MPIYNSIKNLINVKDPNIILNEYSFTQDIIKGVLSNVINAKLTYPPSICPRCGTTHPKVLSKGFSRPSLIRIPNISNTISYLNLKKQRYFCLECTQSFTTTTKLVKPNCFISNNTKTSIAFAFTKIKSAKDIALDHNVSSNTVARVLNSSFNPQKKFINRLPDTLLFDEFKSVKNTSGAMSFIFVDADSNKIIDIVENRQLRFLENYFKRFSLRTRSKVKRIVIDMYMPYMVLIKKMFPNAQIIIDRFHIINHLNRSLNKTRIKLLKKYPKDYSKLKRYWKQLLMFEDDLNDTHYYYHKSFKRKITIKQIIEYLINLDTEFKNTYNIYQDILRCFKYKNHDKFNEIINQKNTKISEDMKISLKTLKRYHELIINSMITKYSNGAIEGINNKIKVIKRVAFGFKSFINFKLRIMICFNLIKKV